MSRHGPRSRKVNRQPTTWSSSWIGAGATKASASKDPRKAKLLPGGQHAPEAIARGPGQSRTWLNRAEGSSFGLEATWTWRPNRSAFRLHAARLGDRSTVADHTTGSQGCPGWKRAALDLRLGSFDEGLKPGLPSVGLKRVSMLLTLANQSRHTHRGTNSKEKIRQGQHAGPSSQFVLGAPLLGFGVCHGFRPFWASCWRVVSVRVWP